MYSLMIVDDSNIIRNKIARSQEGQLFEVVATAEDGLDAIEKFKKHRPNAITMDITMPKMEGLDCIKEIISIDPDVRILVVSALSDKATGIQALELGACGFLCKPFSEDDLNTSLKELMED